MIKDYKRIHFIGIGGIGMSGLARICHQRGFVVSGCDAKLNAMSYRLMEQGVQVEVGHDPSHLDETDLVVYSTAVHPTEPELAQAAQRGIPIMKRGQLLAELAKGKRLIGVAGSHGKTTTSAMASELLVHAGWDPTAVVGGIMHSCGSNVHCGNGQYLVAETDESDGSFLLLSPDIAIVTNIDHEHLNFYGTLEKLTGAFGQYVNQLRPGGTFIRCQDDPLVQNLKMPFRSLSYGLRNKADLTVSRIRRDQRATVFRADFCGRSLGSFRLHAPGQHNVLNALAVIGLGLALDVSLISIREALAAFAGTQRRFQVFRLPNDIWLVEDYAHHPAEIKATLAADPVRERHRLVVFQPHRFSRTQRLEHEFASCFDRADGVIVTDIYSAREAPIAGVSGERLAELIKARGHRCVRYVPREDLSGFVRGMAHAGDTIFFLGAGDIGAMCHDMASQLS